MPSISWSQSTDHAHCEPKVWGSVSLPLGGTCSPAGFNHLIYFSGRVEMPFWGVAKEEQPLKRNLLTAGSQVSWPQPQGRSESCVLSTCLEAAVLRVPKDRLALPVLQSFVQRSHPAEGGNGFSASPSSACWNGHAKANTLGKAWNHLTVLKPISTHSCSTDLVPWEVQGARPSAGRMDVAIPCRGWANQPWARIV